MDPQADGLRFREGARTVVSTRLGASCSSGRVPGRSLWACSGGGLEPGETHGDALRRELHEER